MIPKQPGNLERAVGRKFRESMILTLAFVCQIIISLDPHGITFGTVLCFKIHSNMNCPSNLKKNKHKMNHINKYKTSTFLFKNYLPFHVMSNSRKPLYLGGEQSRTKIHAGIVSIDLTCTAKRVHVKRCNLMLNFWSVMTAPIACSGQAAK